jgi:hypothetical protein
MLAAILASVQESNAAEIVVECPKVNDRGIDIQTRTLLPPSLVVLETRQEPYFGSPVHFEIHETYWQSGMPPITDAVFHCVYEDETVIDIPVIGMLLRCMRIGSKFSYWRELSISCVSETDPGLLLGK